MSSNSTVDATPDNKYNGVRRRKWGKWVSEIRVPGTSHRLWLGSYATPEAAAVAHDVATYCLRGDSSSHKLNFQLALPAGARFGLSPTSVQKVASDAGLAVDAQLSNSSSDGHRVDRPSNSSRLLSDDGDGEYLDISVEDYAC